MDFWIIHGYSDISRILDISQIFGYFMDIKRIYTDILPIFHRYFMDVSECFMNIRIFYGHPDISWISGYFLDI